MFYNSQTTSTQRTCNSIVAASSLMVLNINCIVIGCVRQGLVNSVSLIPLSVY